MKIYLHALFAATLAALSFGECFAHEVKPAFPDDIDLNFTSNNSAYNVKVNSKDTINHVEVYCDGALLASSNLEAGGFPDIVGSIVGVDLEIDPTSPKCSDIFDLGLYVRDFSAPGDQTVVYWSVGFSEKRIVTIFR